MHRNITCVDLADDHGLEAGLPACQFSRHGSSYWGVGLQRRSS